VPSAGDPASARALDRTPWPCTGVTGSSLPRAGVVISRSTRPLIGMEDAVRGLTLSGRYRLDEKLGAGAMGEVWKGFDLRLHRDVAVKIYPGHPDLEPRRVERFRSEAMICGRLQHPGIVVVHDADEDQGRLYFVMELLNGTDLRRVIAEAPDGLPIDRVIRIGADIADALAAAHAKRIIHRDVKPANIMLLAGDRTKLCDFGIARVIDPDGKATAQVGTVAYMAPEQFDGRPEERSDLYSLGCVLYEMLTGDRPFHGNTPMQVALRHSRDEPKAPSELRADVPVELNELVLHLLAKKPEERPSTASEVAARLKAMLERPAPPRPGKRSGNVRRLPPYELLKAGVPPRKRTDIDDAMASAIEQVLQKAGVDAKVAGYARLPGLTRFEIILGPMTSSAEVYTLRDAFARALDGSVIRLVPMERSSSPLPGVAAVGLEVRQRVPDLISLGDLLREVSSRDELVLGRDRDGTPAVVDLKESPHLLIGGDSIKPDPMRTIVAATLMRWTPMELRLVLIDSRKGGLTPFLDVSHQITEQDLLTWVVAEMERRYADLSATHCRTTEEFNRLVREKRVAVPIAALGSIESVHPRILVVIDELDEFMRLPSAESTLAELVREGRAVGVHVVARTTSPNERTITNRVKGYIPARLALKAASVEESIRVLDQPGAQELWEGEALLIGARRRPIRELRLAAVTDEEIAAIVDHWRG